jgi:TPR repeat protein
MLKLQNTIIQVLLCPVRIGLMWSYALLAATFNMGTFYMTGDGLPPGEVQDGLKAAEYYEKAANLGFMAAALNWGKTAIKT